jgi:hypothetical protein
MTRINTNGTLITTEDQKPNLGAPTLWNSLGESLIQCTYDIYIWYTLSNTEQN